MFDEVNGSHLLRVSLFGEFRVERRLPAQRWETVANEEWGGHSYSRSLLKWLVCSAGRRALRGTVVEALWPEMRSAELVLTNAVSNLRQVLGGHGVLRSFGSHQSTGYELAGQSVVWVDGDACDALLVEAESVGLASVRAVALLEEALRLFGRGGFLEGDGGRWCHMLRVHQEKAKRRCLLWLAEGYEVHGKVWQARGLFCQLLDADPFDEDVWCRFLTFLHRNGMTKDALDYWKEAQIRFKEQGFTLSAASHRLVSRLENEQPSLEMYLPMLSKTFVLPHGLARQGKTLMLPVEGVQSGEQYQELWENIQSLNLQAHEDMLALAWDAFYTSNAQRTARVVENWLWFLRQQRDSSAIEVHSQLSDLCCRFLQLASVLARDRTDFRYGLNVVHEAIAQAFHLENVELIAASLYRQAKLYAARQRYEDAIQDLEGALSYAKRARDPLRCYISMFLAEVYSLFAPGNKDFLRKSLEHLDKVDQAVRAHDVLEGDGSFVKVDVAGLYMIRGDVLRRSGEIEGARSALSIVEASLSKEFRRWQGNLSLSESQLFLADGDVENSCKYLSKALHIFQTTKSLSGLAKANRAYYNVQRVQPSHPDVLELEELLTLKQVHHGG